MARRAYYSEPWEKKVEQYQNFSGGTNTTAAQDMMGDHELTDAVNVSLDERGSVTRRSGMIHHLTPQTPDSEAQGYFRYYKTATSFEEIIAIGGKIEIDGRVMEIEGLAGGFQTTRPIDAVQYYDKMYFATGTKLLQYDGENLAVIEPYRPQPLEALYVGTNGLADNPNDYLSHGTGSTLQLTGVTFSSRYGVMNEPFTLTAYHSKKAEDSVEYQFEYRYPFMEDGKYHLGQDWSDSNKWTFVAEGEGDMQFRVNARVKGLEVASAQFLVPSYRIKPNADPDDVAPEHGGINLCNRILVHWDRLIVYGDTVNFNTLYMSHLKNPAYFPVPNNLRFETTKNEPLSTVVRFRDYLVAFTATSIQALFGKHPAEYRRTVLNTSIGCVAPKSAVVMDNYIVFLSAQGVYYLKSIGYVEDKANVERADVNVANQMPTDSNACAIVEDDQYQLIFPDRKLRYRYFRMLNAWVRDESPYLDIMSLHREEYSLYGQRKNGDMVQFKDDVYRDLDYVYPAVIETKYFDFSQPYHRKKLKELQLTVASTEKDHIADVKLFIDGLNNVDEPIMRKVKFEPTEDYKTSIAKVKIKGSCLRAKIRIEHTVPDYLQVLGAMFVLKLKKP